MMNIELVDMPLDDIQEAPFNYNLHPQNQLDELCKSLEEFGQFKNIVLWQEYCIAGNGLVFAARSLGWESLQAIKRNDLTEDQAKRLCVADNATPYLAQPDPQKLEDLLTSLPKYDDIPGVDNNWLEGLGLLEPSEIDRDAEWQGMPEFEHETYTGIAKELLIRFHTLEDYKDFSTIIQQPLTEKTKSIWFPERPEEISDQRGTKAGLVFSEEE